MIYFLENAVGIAGLIAFLIGSITNMDDSPFEWIPYILCFVGLFCILFWLFTAGEEWKV